VAGLAVSYPNYRDLREQSQSFDGLVAHQRATFSFARSHEAVREMRLGMLVSDISSHVLGIQPQLGRAFTAGGRSCSGRDAVVVLGYDFWKNVLGEDGSVLNSRVWINGVDFTVVGVAPERFTGMDPYVRPSFYTANHDGAATERRTRSTRSKTDRPARSSSRAVSVRGVPAERAGRADDDLEAVLKQAVCRRDASREILVRSELESRVQTDPTTAVAMAMLMGAGRARAVHRLRECRQPDVGAGPGPLRARWPSGFALGVSRSRLFRQLLTESALLALVGARPAWDRLRQHPSLSSIQGADRPADRHRTASGRAACSSSSLVAAGLSAVFVRRGAPRGTA